MLPLGRTARFSNQEEARGGSGRVKMGRWAEAGGMRARRDVKRVKEVSEGAILMLVVSGGW